MSICSSKVAPCTMLNSNRFIEYFTTRIVIVNKSRLKFNNRLVQYLTILITDEIYHLFSTNHHNDRTSQERYLILRPVRSLSPNLTIDCRVPTHHILVENTSLTLTKINWNKRLRGKIRQFALTYYRNFLALLVNKELALAGRYLCQPFRNYLMSIK